MGLRHFVLSAALSLVGLAGASEAAHAEDRVLKVSLQTELQVLDPIITTINATRVFAYLVFDELVAIDSEGHYKPQMLSGWEVSSDRLTYTFHLRDGLKFSDGAPVTSEDCVASIERWAKREGFGAQLMDAAERFTVIDSKTFELKLRRPFAFVIEALGKPGHQIPVMMPARLARLDANTAVPEVVGSGPFIFLKDEWRPGAKAVFARNPDYVPRSEPADGLAGGKVANFDRIELLSIPDQSTRAAALQKGEVDLLEVVPYDYIDVLRKNPKVTIGKQPAIAQNMIAINVDHTHAPFDNPLVRRALQAAVEQKDVMAGLGLPADMYRTCYSIYMCGNDGSSDAGTEYSRDIGPKAAQKLLKEAGYKGEPVVFLHAGTSAILNPVGSVLADQLKQAGFNVDLRTSDYATVAARRLKKAPVAEGGWSVTPLVMAGIDLVNPLAQQMVSLNCLENNPGWYCDPEMSKLLKAYSQASSPAESKKYRDEIQAAFHNNVNYVLAGQFATPPAYRSDLKGMIPFSFPVFWNVRRE
ncbi:ABC transporter substrate-binding protein [Bradyrhizobium manausense]|uniref:ABC transporter substrate-binding protein n=1 Tax=Bradyrhizobium manausense TaxID=989370 RepID=UPI0007C745C7|nr:ABC transporter substrate-binding protein [Bradyrhizobium manausense]